MKHCAGEFALPLPKPGLGWKPLPPVNDWACRERSQEYRPQQMIVHEAMWQRLRVELLQPD